MKVGYPDNGGWHLVSSGDLLVSEPVPKDPAASLGTVGPLRPGWERTVGFRRARMGKSDSTGGLPLTAARAIGIFELSSLLRRRQRFGLAC